MKCTIILFFFVYAVWAAPTEEDPLNELRVGNRQFTADVYKEILKSNSENMIFSPFSAETVLAMLSAGANGPTQEELVKGLRLPDSQEKIQKAFKEFLPKLTSSDEHLKLSSANKIYVANDVKVEPAFEKVAVDIYGSSTENVNFAENVQAAASINKWVEDKTNNKIKELVKAEDVNSDTAMVLVNALYLSAKWAHCFEKYSTRPEKFWKTATESVEVPTMVQTSYFQYYDNAELGAQFLELPYEAENLSMVIVLPHEKEGLKALENNVEKLLQPQPMTRERVDVKLPKFTIESEVKFVDVLKSLGVKKIFEQDADLKGLSSNRKHLFVSNVIQKAFINVTESGTEAAASTAAIVWDRAMIVEMPNPVPPKIFHALHPYTFYIKKNDLILFAGHVTV